MALRNHSGSGLNAFTPASARCPPNINSTSFILLTPGGARMCAAAVAYLLEKPLAQCPADPIIASPSGSRRRSML